MPGVKKLLVAVVGETNGVEEVLSPQAAAQLAKRYCREDIFAQFAAAVGQAQPGQNGLTPPGPSPHQFLIIALDENQGLLEAGLTARSGAKLAEQFHKEQLFLDFAAEIAREAQRLRKDVNQRQQLSLFWQLAEPKMEDGR
jgi:hypothetical protein